MRAATFRAIFSHATPSRVAIPSRVCTARFRAPLATFSRALSTPAGSHADVTHSAVSSKPGGGDYLLPHPIWKGEYLDAVKVTHRPTEGLIDWLAARTIKMIRFNFDWMSGFSFGERTESKYVVRCIFLETVAGVPGSIGGILRHLASLRRMKRDHGWINTLFAEAENERMHLLTFMTLKPNPTPLFRLTILLTQGVFFNFFWMAYLVSPKFCHRLVGYLEEEAVITYTHMLSDIDAGKVWKGTKAPEIAINYWKLAPNATMREVIAVIRADEAHHRDVNHGFASLKPNEENPYKL